MKPDETATTVKTSVNSRAQNHKVLWVLLATITVIAVISITYITIYPNL